MLSLKIGISILFFLLAHAQAQKTIEFRQIAAVDQSELSFVSIFIQKSTGFPNFSDEIEEKQAIRIINR